MVVGALVSYSLCARFFAHNGGYPSVTYPKPRCLFCIFAEEIKQDKEMNTLLADIWPILLTALIGVIIAYARYVNALKTRVAVLEKTVEDLLKTIESMQKRLDSHSRKQDEIYDTLNDVKGNMSDMKVEIVKEMGQMTANLSSLASDLKGLNNLLAISDVGIKINRNSV